MNTKLRRLILWEMRDGKGHSIYELSRNKKIRMECDRDRIRYHIGIMQKEGILTKIKGYRGGYKYKLNKKHTAIWGDIIAIRGPNYLDLISDSEITAFPEDDAKK